MIDDRDDIISDERTLDDLRGQYETRYGFQWVVYAGQLESPVAAFCSYGDAVRFVEAGMWNNCVIKEVARKTAK